MNFFINIIAWIALIAHSFESVIRAFTSYNEYDSLPIMMIVVFMMVWDIWSNKK